MGSGSQGQPSPAPSALSLEMQAVDVASQTCRIGPAEWMLHFPAPPETSQTNAFILTDGRPPRPGKPTARGAPMSVLSSALRIPGGENGGQSFSVWEYGVLSVVPHLGLNPVIITVVLHALFLRTCHVPLVSMGTPPDKEGDGDKYPEGEPDLA